LEGPKAGRVSGCQRPREPGCRGLHRTTESRCPGRRPAGARL